MHQELVILRGLPGSGKSTMAKNICHKGENVMHIELDHVLSMAGIEYSEMKSAQWRKAYSIQSKRVIEALRQGMSVVLANCFYSLRGVMRFASAARLFHIPVRIIDVPNAWDIDWSLSHNRHGLTREEVEALSNKSVPTTTLIRELKRHGVLVANNE